MQLLQTTTFDVSVMLDYAFTSKFRLNFTFSEYFFVFEKSRMPDLHNIHIQDFEEMETADPYCVILRV